MQQGLCVLAYELFMFMHLQVSTQLMRQSSVPSSSSYCWTAIRSFSCKPCLHACETPHPYYLVSMQAPKQSLSSN